MRPGLAFVLLAVGLALAYFAARAVSPGALAMVESRVTGLLGDLLARFEGYRAEPYQDEAGLWTIGIGHLIIDGDGFWSPRNPSGVDFISREDARALAERDAATAAAAVDRFVLVPLTVSQRTALVSLAFNIGAGAFASSTLVRLLNAGDYAAAAEQFAVWNKVRDQAGQLVASSGLSARRADEAALFLS